MKPKRTQSELRGGSAGNGAEWPGDHQPGDVQNPDHLRNKPMDLLINPELRTEDFSDDTGEENLEELGKPVG